MINVTKTYLPPKEKYKAYIDRIYSSGKLTNNGPLVNELERRLEKYLGVKNIVLVSNGTAAMEIAYRALDIKGSAITTPFSFVATTSSLVTNKIRPLFCDIDKSSLNIDSNQIESIIESDTELIVPVHVFGNPCRVEAIDKIAKEHSLKVVYDAAHAFNVKYKGTSVLNYGDISTVSFHATKLFHTIEGGALIVNDDKLVRKVRLLINFGIENAESIPSIGTNAKMNEFEAAMGLCVLDDIESIQLKREEIYNYYFEQLKDVVSFQLLEKETTHNYSYVPIILSSVDKLNKVQSALNNLDIFPRRYFYPSLDTLSYVDVVEDCSNSRDIASKILCLPSYHDITKEEQREIVSIIRENL